MVVGCSQIYGGSSGEEVGILANNIWVGHGVEDAGPKYGFFFDYVCTIRIERPEKLILTEIGRQVYGIMLNVQSGSFSIPLLFRFAPFIGRRSPTVEIKPASRTR